MTTTGDIVYASSGSTPGRIGIGSTGDVLTVAGGIPSWAAPAGGGKVAQVLQTVKADTFTSNSTSFTDITGLSVTITPTLNTSKILVSYSVSGASTEATSSSMAAVRLMRGSTVIGVANSAGLQQLATGGISTRLTGSQYMTITAAGDFLDSPATTSATTYKIQGYVGGGTFFINQIEDDASNASIYRTISTITVMEILA